MTPERIGPYRILEKIGSGGMGQVYLGEHDETQARAAIKVLSASLAQEGGFVDRFNREIDAMRKLDNPHIVKLFESGMDGGNYYYAMEYVPGETLMAMMRREKRLPWQKAVEIAVQICQALKSAHDHGIIHRDLKPSNLLVAENDFIKLTDFGVAQVFASQRLTITGGIIGTAEYMSPEQAEGKRAGKQSDLYSLGAVMYTMITGRTPFSGSTAVEVIQKHRFGLFDRPSLFVDDLPKRVEETICRLLEKDPAKRFPDALVLLRHLEQIVRHEEFAEKGATKANTSPSAPDAVTMVVSGSSAADESAADGRPGIPGPATLMQGLMRAELEELNRGHWLSSLFNSLAVQLTLLTLVVGGGVWWFWPRPVSQQALFDKGVAAMEQQAGPGWIQARRESFDKLLANDPETWREQVEPYLNQIKLYELGRSSGVNRRKKGAAPESESERLLQLALHYRQIGDYTRAQRILNSLHQVLAGIEPRDAEQQRIFDLSAQSLKEWGESDAEQPDRNRLVEAALARADELAQDPATAEQARAIWSSLVELYGYDSSAAGYVERARSGLARLAPNE
ncbi:MAG: serine/threonine protein kinase [Planctomycetaceae bacterium]|nr:serine/threonine protein kinase [Planctomycetaceae bacterium]